MIETLRNASPNRRPIRPEPSSHCSAATPPPPATAGPRGGVGEGRSRSLDPRRWGQDGELLVAGGECVPARQLHVRHQGAQDGEGHLRRRPPRPYEGQVSALRPCLVRTPAAATTQTLSFVHSPGTLNPSTQITKLLGLVSKLARRVA